MGKYFGTDGFRAEANVGLTAEHAFKIGRYLGSLLSREKKSRVVIGKDTRRSSYMYEYAITAGFVASGVDVYLLHVTTTPSVAYVVRTEGFDGGVMISASHNPYTDNGIKLIGSQGEKLGESVTDEIEAYLDGERPEPRYAKGEDIGRTFDYSAGRNRYIGYLISLATRSFRGKRIGLDCSNGSAWMIGKSVFDALGASTYVISDSPDGLNINRGCGSTHIDALKRLVVENSLDAGFAFDGDADRCIAVDENGRVIDGDGIIYLSAKYLKKEYALSKNTVVVTVMSNGGLEAALAKEGIETVRTAVGDRFVYEKLMEGGYSLGGEESGHIVFTKYASAGDGILTAIKIMEVMLEEKKPLSQLTSGLVYYPHTQINVKVKDREAALESEEVKALVSEFDAIREEKELRLILRKSGTEPLIRVFVEGRNIDDCRIWANRFAMALEGSDE